MTPDDAQRVRARLLESQAANAQLELKDRALAACAEGITIADARLPDQPLIYINAGFERLTGYPVSETLGRNCRFLQGPATCEETVDALRIAIREQRAVTVQLLNYRKDGTPFWNRLSITPVRDASGAVTHLIGVQSDVTEEVQAKEELRLSNIRLETAARIIREDLAAAAESQQALLPADLPQLPGFRFAYRFKPCIDVGGDALNVIPLDDDHVAIYILDVSGHGVAAALLSVTLTHMLGAAPDRSFLYQADPRSPGRYSIASPSDVIARLNEQFLMKPGAARYFTMVYGILRQSTAEFRYAAAGHLGPIQLRRATGPVVSGNTGIPVGLIAGVTYEEQVLRLEPGDRLYICTDGIYESENSDQQEFGVHGLLQSLAESQEESLDASLSSVLRRMEDWAGAEAMADDASILAIERAH